MTFNHDHLHVLAYGGGFTLWHYTLARQWGSTDYHTFFDPAHAMLRLGDFIMLNYVGETGNLTKPHPKGLMLVVARVAEGRVGVEPMTGA